MIAITEIWVTVICIENIVKYVLEDAARHQAIVIVSGTRIVLLIPWIWLRVIYGSVIMYVCKLKQFGSRWEVSLRMAWHAFVENHKSSLVYKNKITGHTF